MESTTGSNLSQTLIKYVNAGLRDQGIIIPNADITLSTDGEHFIFLARHVGTSNAFELASYLTRVWRDKTLKGINHKLYFLETDNMEVDSRPSETEVNIKFKTLIL